MKSFSIAKSGFTSPLKANIFFTPFSSNSSKILSMLSLVLYKHERWAIVSVPNSFLIYEHKSIVVAFATPFPPAP